MRSLSILFLLFCYLAIPYPYCYKEVSRQETAGEIRIFFVKNEFFKDCSVNNHLLLKSDKDVVIYLDGKEHKQISKEQACLQ